MVWERWDIATQVEKPVDENVHVKEHAHGRHVERR